MLHWSGGGMRVRFRGMRLNVVVRAPRRIYWFLAATRNPFLLVFARRNDKILNLIEQPKMSFERHEESLLPDVLRGCGDSSTAIARPSAQGNPRSE